MIAVDTNILIYAHREDADFHDSALKAVSGLADGQQQWSIPWPCLHEFLAVVTHPRIFRPPTPTSTALETIAVWLQSPTCELIGEEPGYFEIFRDTLSAARVSGPVVHDARVAAICVHHDATLWTADRDFSRFPNLKTVNPLQM